MRKIWLVVLMLAMVACGNTSGSRDAEQQQIKSDVIATFNADSAYRYVEEQVSFGARVPGTEQHEQCAAYLLSNLGRMCDTAFVQVGKVQLYNGQVVECKNIIGSFAPKCAARVLLCAHWDSRPYSDQEQSSALQRKAVLGADDGASGVGVLLELARQFSMQNPAIGVDIVLFDVEDYGAPEFYEGSHGENSWCLGSQYWARNLHQRNYRARYGILLDMVGGESATFMREQVSSYFAPKIVDKVWGVAKELGFSSRFVDRRGGAITDDHLYVNQLAGIPCIDIIHQCPESATGFPAYWHTQYDDMRNISKQTLYEVGQTLMYVIYKER